MITQHCHRGGVGGEIPSDIDQFRPVLPAQPVTVGGAGFNFLQADVYVYGQERGRGEETGEGVGGELARATRHIPH